MLLFTIGVLTVVFIVFSWINMLMDAKRLSVDGPFPLPLTGNGHLFLGDSTKFLKTLLNFTNKYGKVLRFYILSQRFILLTDPKLIEIVTSSTEMITKGTSYDFLKPWLGLGLLTSGGMKWKTHRKFLTPAFHFNILQNFLPVFLKNEKILIAKLEKLANGTEINLFPIIALAALDNVTESVMGVSFNAQTDTESKYVKSIEKLCVIISQRMRNPFTNVDAIFSLLPQKKVHDEAIKILHDHTRKVIQARRADLKKLNINKLNYDSDHGIKNRHAFLDLLLLAEMDGKKIDDENIREEVDTFMFEGHDTTTSGIVFALYCISKYPDVQETILKEQRSILSDDIERDPTYGEVQQMKYLEMVIKEALRIYPSVPLIERLITRDTDIGGILVPKNTSILIDVFHMQRHPDFYENPLDFRPQRFEAINNPFHWLVFSAGPRNCIGQKFAMIEMKVTVAAIVKRFTILPCNKEPLLGADLILRSPNGVHIMLKTR